MLKRIVTVSARLVCEPLSKRFHDSRFRVTVVGAAGGIGQPLSLLLKLNPLVSQLTLYDLKSAVGVAADVSHIDRVPVVTGFDGAENLPKALKCADVVVIPAGLPRKPGQSRDDLFKSNADVVVQVAAAIAGSCPEAFIAIITNPINSTVPVAAEVLKKLGAYNPKRLFGVTTLDIVRAKRFIASSLNIDPLKVKVSVIGGHSGTTIVPIISRCEPEFKGSKEDIEELTKRIQNAGTEIVEAKAGKGSATLSMAHAAAEFVNSLLQALSGKKDVHQMAYIESDLTEAKYFASPLLLDSKGITEIPGIPNLSAYEEALLCEALPQLMQDIEKGTSFGKAFKGTKQCDDL